MAEVTSKKRKLVDFSEETITVVVGPSAKRFTLHPSTLTHSSLFFRSKFSGRWSNANEVILQDVDPDIFQIYATYTYTNDIDLPQQSPTGPEQAVTKNPDLQKQYLTIIRLYILADMLSDMGLRNLCMDKMQDLAGEEPKYRSRTAIDLAFAETSEKSTLCRYLLDLFLSGTDKMWLEKALPNLPYAFVNGLLLGWAEASRDKSIELKHPKEVPRCQYHEHNDETPMDSVCAQGFADYESASKKSTPTKKSSAKKARY